MIKYAQDIIYFKSYAILRSPIYSITFLDFLSSYNSDGRLVHISRPNCLGGIVNLAEL